MIEAVAIGVIMAQFAFLWKRLSTLSDKLDYLVRRIDKLNGEPRG